MTDRQIVFENMLDNRYPVRVERTGAYEGELVVLDGDKELLREKVGLRYGAQFGPDIEDVDEWCERAANFVDGMNNGQSDAHN